MAIVRNRSLVDTLLPRQILIDCLRRYIPPGQDKVMTDFVRIILAGLSGQVSEPISAKNMYILLMVSRLEMGREAEIAKKFLPLIIKTFSTLPHENAKNFAAGVIEESRFFGERYNSGNKRRKG